MNDNLNSFSSSYPIIPTGYEVVLPTSGIRVFVRGITVKEQLEFQKTYFISNKSLLEKTLFFATLTYNCLIDPPFSFQEYIDLYTEEDANAICLGILHQSFGKNFKITEFCPETKKATTININLDKVIISEGNINTENNPIELETVTIDDIILVKNKYITLADSLCFFTLLASVGIYNIDDNFKLTPLQIETYSMLRKILTVRSYKVPELEVESIRPSYTKNVQLKKWFDFLSSKLINKNTYQLSVLNYSVTPLYRMVFSITEQCECGSFHEFTLNFLQCLIELSSLST